MGGRYGALPPLTTRHAPPATGSRLRRRDGRRLMFKPIKEWCLRLPVHPLGRAQVARSSIPKPSAAGLSELVRRVEARGGGEFVASILRLDDGRLYHETAPG